MLQYFHELLRGDADFGEKNKKETTSDTNSNLVIDIMIAAAVIIVILIIVIMIFKWTKNLEYKTPLLDDAEDPTDHKNDIMKSFKVGNERLHLLTDQIQTRGDK